MSDKPAKDRDEPKFWLHFDKEMETISLRQQRPQEDLNYKSSDEECGDDGMDGVLEEGKAGNDPGQGYAEAGVKDGVGESGDGGGAVDDVADNAF